MLKRRGSRPERCHASGARMVSGKNSNPTTKEDDFRRGGGGGGAAK